MGYKKGENMNTNTGMADISGQKERLLLHLQTHRSITRAGMLSKLGIANGPEIIRRLREDGHCIRGEKVPIRRRGRKTTYTRYILEADK